MIPKNKTLFVVGLGLIGASVAKAFQRNEWRVSGIDSNVEITNKAVALGIIDSDQLEDDVDLVVIATPAGTVASVAQEILNNVGPQTIVTDTASVKTAITLSINDDRFIAGHPMAGSELRGLEGSRADLFVNCNWVLTPRSSTNANSYVLLHGYLRDLGANVLSISAADHDRLVAVASHVPHILAGSLMNEADELAKDDTVLLQLAAGGFRDMTRIAAGDPNMWPDVLMENKDAILENLSKLEDRIDRMRRLLSEGNREALLAELEQASNARRLLPGRTLQPSQLRHIRVELDDRPGNLASVTTLASENNVNIFDIEIAHGIEGDRGALLLTIPEDRCSSLVAALRSHGFVVGT